uniref:Uncharacterized protein n=1 Tax=Plectus sambesii TaxID=2011161 RepID=A0A914W328_9BILA
MLIAALYICALVFGASEATNADLIVEDTQPNCPTGWQYGSPFKSCYFMASQSLNWPDAQVACENIGGNLASISSSQEYAFLIRLAYAANPLYMTWIGLHAINNMSPFQWADGTPANYSKWLQGQPSDFGGLCVGWRTTYGDNSDGWRNIACESQQQFICKQSAEYCPNGAQSGSSGSVSSSNYPKNYENNLNCIYQIVVQAGLRVNLTFDDFDTETTYDRLYIFDGPNIQSPSLKNLTGHSPKGWNDSIQSSGNSMALFFHTDSTNTFRGWHANWAAISLNESFCPNGQQSGYTGPLTSPNYPNNYDNRLDCLYRITSTSKLARIRITFDYFYTESCCDKLTLYDGPTIHSPQIKTLSGTMPGGTNYTSTGYVMTLLFHTDYSVNYKGFSASWISVA